jgi:galactose mutarotase-like enzyme
VTELQLPTVSLRDERSGLEASFVPGAGMLCSSLRHHGAELLAQNDGVGAYARHGTTMGIPLLYPWANRLAGFDYAVAGRTVELPSDPGRIAVDEHGLPIHGVIGGRLAWELAQASGPPAKASGPPAESLTARLSWSESRPELFEVFPFRHDLRYEARLGGGRLEVQITVHACGADPVPVAFGFHPYLSLADAAREHWLIELPAMRHLALDDHQIPLGTGQAHEAQRFELAAREFDDGFDAVTEPARFSATAGRRVALEFLQGYPCAQVFAPRASQFICFEPMTAPTNALRSSTGLPLLQPGESYNAHFRVSVDDRPPRTST